jgi:tripartite-type tricarboxylate transporter receptor subunit TctC
MTLAASRNEPGTRRSVLLVAILALFALVAAACGEADEVAEPTEPEEEEVAEEPDEDDVAEEAEEDVEEAFYQEGDLLEIMVPFGEGGGTDTLARIAAPYLADALGGVNVQVVNVPGGGGVLGTNEFTTRRDPDGYTVLMHSASSQVPPIVGEAGVQYRLDDHYPIAGFPLGGVIYAHADSPFQEANHLTGEHQPQQILYAGQPAAGGELRILLIFEMFGADVNAVLGHDGRGPARLAWEQGESDISYDTAPAYLDNVHPLVEDGEALQLMTFGFPVGDRLEADPSFDHLPHPGEVYEEVYGEPLAGDAFDAYMAISVATISLNKTLVIHPDAPPEAIAQLEAAWEDLLQDEEFIEAADVELGGYPILIGDDVHEAWNGLAAVDTDDPAIQWLLGWVNEMYGVQLDEGG